MLPPSPDASVSPLLSLRVSGHAQQNAIESGGDENGDNHGDDAQRRRSADVPIAKSGAVNQERQRRRGIAGATLCSHEDYTAATEKIDQAKERRHGDVTLKMWDCNVTKDRP